MRTRLLAVLAAVCVAVGVSSTFVPSAAAVQTAQPNVVSDNPVDYTPGLLDGEVDSIMQVGNTIVIGGTFTQIQAATGGPVITRNHLAAFNASTGAISTSFNPAPDGQVTTVISAGDGTSVYIGGFFNTVTGKTAKSLARVNISDGSLVAGFKAPSMDGRVKDLRLSGGRLWVAGTFGTVGGNAQPALATVNPTSGTFDPYMNMQFGGPRNGGSLQVLKMDITPGGSRLIAIGNFTTVESQPYSQAILIDSGVAGHATFANWQTNFYTSPCSSSFDSYMRDVDFSPDGAYFVITTTGAYGGANSACDQQSRWETNATGSDLRPTWTNYTGGDTTYAVAVTGTAVYVGGHFRWANNAYAGDQAGRGAVAREGIAALDPANGLPLNWNPGRAKGVGVFDLLATSTGLWVGSDTDRIGHFETHKKLAYFPLAGGESLPAPETGSLPGNVYLGGSTTPTADSSTLYRVNAGGGPLLATDDGPDWSGDTDASPDPDHNSGSNTASYDTVANLDPSVPAGTPRGIFSSERWSPSDTPPMTFTFPVTAGQQVDVRLYFANRYTGTGNVGDRVQNVAINGNTVLPNYDIVADAGDQTGTMKSFTVTSPGAVTITFTHATENPLVNGIEIVKSGGAAGGTGVNPADSLAHRSYDGNTTVGATAAADNGGIAWHSVRGSFSLNGSIYTGQADGSFVKRTYDGSTFGSPVAIDTADQLVPEDWHDDVPNITGMFFSGGNIYYTRSGDSTLYARGFTPSSRVVGTVRQTASGNVSGIDFSQVKGMFETGGKLYWATRNDGVLHRIDFTDGAPVAGTATDVSGPSIDGNDWRARGLFLYGATAPPANAAPHASISVSCTGRDCDATSVGSTDSDGSIVSYAWDFGDGATATGPTAKHTYTTNGSFTVTLTVTDNDGATGSATQKVTVQAQNQSPTAAFTLNCDGLDCTGDASGSTDPDGTIASYAWDFGDGTATGVKPSHTFDSAGAKTVTLTVTDNLGATDTATKDVTVADAQNGVSYVGSDQQSANAGSFSVKVPSAAAGGDGLILFITTNVTATIPTPTGVTGWQQIDSLTSGGMTTTAWRKAAAAGDPGKTVTVAPSGSSKGDLSVVAYRGTDTSDPLGSAKVSTETVTRAAHTTPSVTAAGNGSWLVSYWADKSSSSTAFGVPASVTSRTAASGTGGGRITSLVADGGAAAGSGTQGGITASADSSSSHAMMWSVLLAPARAGGGNALPTASASVSCTDLTCSADGTGSSDSDGTVTGYAWDFGDGTTGTGSTVSHTYSTADTYTIRLTVTDNDGGTKATTVTKTVTAPAATAVGFVDSANSNASTGAAKVTLPAVVKAGDGLVLVASWNRDDATASTPAGWTSIDTKVSSGMSTQAWQRVAVAGDAGNTVTVPLSIASKVDLTALVYRGTNGDAPVGASAVSTEGTTRAAHTTPTVNVTGAGSWLASYWADKSSASTAFGVPAGTTSRGTGAGSASGRITSLSADSGATVAAGTRGGIAASADSASSHAMMWTFELRRIG